MKKDDGYNHFIIGLKFLIALPMLIPVLVVFVAIFIEGGDPDEFLESHIDFISDLMILGGFCLWLIIGLKYFFV